MKKRFRSQPVDVGEGYSVEFTFKRGEILCEWTPDFPSADKLEAVRIPYQLALWNFIAARMTRFEGDTGVIVTEIR